MVSLPEGEYFTGTEAAAALGLTPRMIHMLREQGRLAAIRAGWSYLYPRDIVEAEVRSRAQGGDQRPRRAARGP
jgi:hypothetical protein